MGREKPPSMTPAFIGPRPSVAGTRASALSLFGARLRRAPQDEELVAPIQRSAPALEMSLLGGEPPVRCLHKRRWNRAFDLWAKSAGTRMEGFGRAKGRSCHLPSAEMQPGSAATRPYSRYGVSTTSIHFMNARTRRDRLLRCATTMDTASARRRESGKPLQAPHFLSIGQSP